MRLPWARPYVRVAPLEKAHRTEPDYGTLPAQGATYSAAIGDGAAVVATSYRPALTAATWQDEQPIAPWRMNELWLMTEHGMIGLMESVCLEDTQARELCHMFRFIPPGREATGKSVGESTYECGELRFRVWKTDLPFVIEERTRRYALNPKGRRDWQLCLSDVDRSPEHVAQGPPAEGEEKPPLKLPERRDYAKGYRRASLIEVSPHVGGFSQATLGGGAPLVVFHARAATMERTAVYNATDTVQTYQLSKDAERVVTSWSPVRPPTAATKLTMPPRSVAMVVR